MYDGKIVVFFNVGAFCICKYKDVAIKKIDSFLDSIKSENVIVWLRPHPQIIKEIHQLDASMIDQYISVINKYKEREWIVFDETHDFEDAYQCSDIYYGDYGNVRNRFIEDKKPVVDINYDGCFFPIGICKCGNYIFGTNHDTGSIVRYSINDNKWEYVSIIPKYEGISKAFHKSVCIDNIIYFIPYMATTLITYNTLNGIITEISLDIEHSKIGSARTCFFGFCVYSNKLFLLPASYSNMIYIDLNTQTTHNFLDLSTEISSEKGITLLSWTKFEDNKIAIVSIQKNEIIIIDLLTAEKRVVSLGKSDYLFNAIKYHNKKLIIAVKNYPKLLAWDYLNNVIEEISIEEDDTIIYGPSYLDDHAFSIYKDKCYCFPANSNLACVVDIDNKSVKALNEIKNILAESYKESQFDTVTVDNNMVYIQHISKKFFNFDMESERIVQSVELKMSREDTIRQEIDLISGIANRIKTNKERFNEHNTI